MRPQTRAVLFDLDDTLLDYSGSVESSWKEACEACCSGIDVNRLVEALAETRRWFWSDPARHRRERVNMLQAWQRIAAHALEQVGAPDNGLSGVLAADFAKRRRMTMNLFPESLEVLDALRRKDIRLGLVTNGDATQQRDKIARFELERFFTVMVIEGEFGAGKPDAVVYKHALERLGVAAHETAMVGDHLEFDIAGSQRLGLEGIWVDRSRSGLGSSAVRPDRIVQSLREIGPEKF